MTLSIDDFPSEEKNKIELSKRLLHRYEKRFTPGATINIRRMRIEIVQRIEQIQNDIDRNERAMAATTQGLRRVHGESINVGFI